MKNYLSIAFLSAGLLGIPMLTGCEDKTVTSKETAHQNADGSTSVDKSKTTTDSNGNTTKTEEHKSTP